jgi:hypothetical protein
LIPRRKRFHPPVDYRANIAELTVVAAFHGFGLLIALSFEFKTRAVVTEVQRLAADPFVMHSGGLDGNV